MYTHIILVYYYKCMSMPFDFCTFLFPLTALCSVLQTLHLGTPKVGSLMVCLSQSICSLRQCPILSLRLHSSPHPHSGSCFPLLSHLLTLASHYLCYSTNLYSCYYVSSYYCICVLILFILFATACITYRSRWCVVKEKRGRC